MFLLDFVAVVTSAAAVTTIFSNPEQIHPDYAVKGLDLSERLVTTASGSDNTHSLTTRLDPRISEATLSALIRGIPKCLLDFVVVCSDSFECNAIS